eukprot:1159958-Pelagomonas_calceolata.AAC.2
MPTEKGPEWDYVKLVQPEGTYGVKQGKNKCKLCECVFHQGATRIRLHFLQVPGCGGAKSTAAEDTWVDVGGEEEGEEEGGQQEEGSSSHVDEDEEGWFTGEEEDRNMGTEVPAWQTAVANTLPMSQDPHICTELETTAASGDDCSVFCILPSATWGQARYLSSSCRPSIEPGTP